MSQLIHAVVALSVLMFLCFFLLFLRFFYTAELRIHREPATSTWIRPQTIQSYSSLLSAPPLGATFALIGTMIAAQFNSVSTLHQ